MSEHGAINHWPRRIAGLGLAVGCSGLAGGLYGAVTPTDVQVGPHQATAELTFDDTYTIDAGVLGSLSIPDATGYGVGARLALGEIPAAENATSTDDLSAIVTQYEILFSDPAQSVENLKATVVKRVEHDATTGALAGLALGGAALFGMSKQSDERRAAFKTALSVKPNHYRAAKAAALSALVLTACAAGNTPAAKEQYSHTSPVFAGTPLENAQISGRLLQLAVDNLAPRIVGFIRDTQDYYGTVSQNFEAAFQDRVKDNPWLTNDSIVWFQSISDNHCNIGMDAVHGAIARAFDIDFTVDSGDSTMSGTAAEAECIAQEAGQIDNPIVWLRGNHDSIENTQAQAAANGMIVVDNFEPVEIAGLTIVGEGDPRQSVFGTSIAYRGEETLDDQAESLREAACGLDDRPDILLVHAPEAALPTLEDGCATLSISGDTHHLSEPRLISDEHGESYQFTEGTSGGAAPGGITVGTLKAPAVQTIFAYDSASEAFVGYYVITVSPDQSVDISAFHTMPLAYGTAPSGPN